MSDVIRITKSQKESIEKLIPELLKEYDYQFEDNKFLTQMNKLYTEKIKERDYSFILSSLIVCAASDLGVSLTNL